MKIDLLTEIKESYLSWWNNMSREEWFETEHVEKYESAHREGYLAGIKSSQVDLKIEPFKSERCTD